MQTNEAHPAAEIAAEQADQLRHREVLERRIAACFQLRRQASAEIRLDLRPAEGSEVIDARAAPVRASEKPAFLLEFIGIGE